MVMSRGSVFSSIENSKYQSLALFFKAAAYDAFGADALDVFRIRPSLGFGVDMRVPSGVCASTLDPSAKASVDIQLT